MSDVKKYATKNSALAKWLQEEIAAYEKARDEIPFGLAEDEVNVLESYRLALAALNKDADIDISGYREYFDQPAHISPLVPARPGVVEKLSTSIEVKVRPVSFDNDVHGYIIHGKRTNGVACNTAIFPDCGSPADQLLYALIKELSK